MSFLEAFLNILAILGIIVAGGFLIFFLGNLLLSILDPSRKKTFVDEGQQFVEKPQQPTYQEPESYQEPRPYEEQKPYQEPKEVPSQEFFLDDEPATIEEGKFTLEEDVQSVDFKAAQDEKNSVDPYVPTSDELIEKPEEKEEDLNSLFNDDKEFDFDDFDFDAFFEEQNKENAEKQKEQEEKPQEQEEVVQVSNETIQEEPEITQEEQPVSDYVAPQQKEPEIREVIKEVYIENHAVEDALRSEIEQLRSELAEQRKLYEELKLTAIEKEAKLEKEKADLIVLYEESEKQEEQPTGPLLTIDEYKARLETLRARLSVNEKEFKANKKEFIPLRRVRKNLDKDREKLRRREALVAKQKVMLYGVNNIVEIDQEKAQKLAEDLDLLDGLKVSVRHCEEVMEANKDRYPILETANRILATTNKELKADIAECEEAIRKLLIESGDIDDEGRVLVNGEPVQEQPVKRKRGRPRKEVKPEPEFKPSAEDDKVIHSAAGVAASTIAPVVSNTEIFEAKEPENAFESEVVLNEQEIKSMQEEAILQDIMSNFETETTEEELPEIDVSNQPKQPHVFDFDAEEPSFDDLFAIENEENNDDF